MFEKKCLRPPSLPPSLLLRHRFGYLRLMLRSGGSDLKDSQCYPKAFAKKIAKLHLKFMVGAPSSSKYFHFLAAA